MSLTSLQQVGNKSTSLFCHCNGIWETTWHSRLLPMPTCYGLAMGKQQGNWCNGFWPWSRLCFYFRLRYDENGLVHSCGFASAEDATSSDVELWMPWTTNTVMADDTAKLEVDTAKYIISHVGSGFCEMIEQEKSAMSWMSPGGLMVYLLYQSVVIGTAVA